MLVVMMVVMLD
jgi:hypothetical protein